MENVLERVARPVAERRLPLIVVLDGMSAAVGCQLAEDIIAQRRWVEVGRREDGREPVIATVPSITSISRTSLLCGKLRTGGQAEEHAGFAAFWRPRTTRLFHKGDLRGVPGTGLNSAVRDAIHDPAAVVGVVLNTVDDTLDRGREGDAPQWRLAGIRYLSDLLDEAARAGRPVILTSDHGHLPDRGAPIHEERSAAARYRAGTPGPGELIRPRPARAGRRRRGRRGMGRTDPLHAAQGRVSRRRRAIRSGRPRPRLRPVGVASARAAGMCSAPAGMLPPGGTPSLPDSITAEAAEPSGDALFGVSEIMLGGLRQPFGALAREPGHRIGSVRRPSAGSPGGPEAGQVARLIDRLAEAGGKVPVMVAAEAVGEPPFRMSGYLAQVARLLNVDGYL